MLLSWYHAKERCKEHRGTLVTIRNRLELSHIEKLIDDKKDFWIGFKRCITSHGFCSTNSDPHISYYNLIHDIPNNGDCVQMKGLSNFTLVTEHCNETRRYICTLSGM